MTPDEAFEFINQLFLSHQQTSLNECHQALVRGIWENKTYQTISNECRWNHQHLRDTGSKLYRELQEISGIEITKNNFKVAIESLSIQARDRQTTGLVEFREGTVRENHFLDNPFVPFAGRIDDPQLFFNRDRNLRSIFELLNSRSSVAVIGERQIGKSSLLKAIERQAQDRLYSPRQPIYLNLQDLENEDDFYSYFCDETGVDECRGYPLRRNLRDKRLLVLIDEVEKMTGNGFTHQVRDCLRSLAEGSNAPLRLVMAARESMTSLFDEGKTSPLANICIEERLDVWDEKTARDFIAHRLEPTAVRFSEEEIVQLIAESGGHPKKLMYLCYRLYQRYREGKISET